MHSCHMFKGFGWFADILKKSKMTLVPGVGFVFAGKGEARKRGRRDEMGGENEGKRRRMMW
jgi:hypothetical protein